ncbi:protogenin [Eublepharis macularius]|uniref:Protogenin n=1 Tax=Eublepharis macularius TaxID=481883 RepID=A0AA97LLU4_EUBMA|nr:protogenin [Eublepharis macularius]
MPVSLVPVQQAVLRGGPVSCEEAPEAGHGAESGTRPELAGCLFGQRCWAEKERNGSTSRLPLPTGLGLGRAGAQGACKRAASRLGSEQGGADAREAPAAGQPGLARNPEPRKRGPIRAGGDGQGGPRGTRSASARPEGAAALARGLGGPSVRLALAPCPRPAERPAPGGRAESRAGRALQPGLAGPVRCPRPAFVPAAEQPPLAPCPCARRPAGLPADQPARGRSAAARGGGERVPEGRGGGRRQPRGPRSAGRSLAGQPVSARRRRREHVPQSPPLMAPRRMPPRRPPPPAARLLLLLAAFASGARGFSELFFVKEPQDATVGRREAAALDCQARGEAPITLSWLRDGQAVAESERLRALPNGSLLLLGAGEGEGAARPDGPFYQCLARNKYGALLSHKARLALAAMSAFEVQPLPAEVHEGSVARFACKISAHPPAVITWEVNRTALPMATDRITALPSGVLQIYNVQQKDAGNYRCVAASLASRRKSAEATLTVVPASTAKPFRKPVIIASPQNTTASLHQTVIFECLATGHPKPIVSWSRLDHKSIDVFSTRVLGSGNLMISDVKAQHSGVYVCRATIPGTRNFTTAMAALVVHAPPSFVEWPESLTRPRAGTARFACQAEGIPTPRVTWLKNGRKVHSNGRIKMYNSKLVINQIIPEDDAIYQCLAENSEGSLLARARLTVVLSEDRPSAPCNVHAETMSSSAILLAWERPLYNSDKVIAYSVHYMKAEGLNNEEYQVVIGNDTTHYIIEDLEPASNYTFYLVAYMPMGASQMSDHVTQHTLEDVPLRAPEISLTSRSPTDILVSWLPIPAKYRRGQVASFRLSFRRSTESSVQVVELPGSTYEYLLRNLNPDTIYLVRITAATRVGWGEASLWTSHRTPKATSIKAPKSPELRLEPLNCTTIAVKWQPGLADTATIQGYKLYYKEEGQQESAPVLLEASVLAHTVSGLDPRRKYHVRLLAYNSLEEGYQADQTVSTPGCVSVRDRLAPPPPPPHHLYAQANTSSAIYLHWGRPAFTSAQVINYTVRCNPVGLQNASLVLYLQTSETHLLVEGLEPNTKYEFAVRLHVDQLSSPWSPILYHTTLPEAPSGPPLGVKVTLIEEDTALVSWKPPEGERTVVSRYTILYASRKAWIAGEWQILYREGTITMALLEQLLAGNIYIVQIAASNEAGEGPFSSAVELAVLPKEAPESNQRPKRLDSAGAADTAPSGYYPLDQKSMTGLLAGVCIALTCIVLCILILVYRSKARKSAAPKSVPRGSGHLSGSSLSSGGASESGKSVEAVVENESSLLPRIVGSSFLDAKGGTDLIINSYGPVTNSSSKKKWTFFQDLKKGKLEEPQKQCATATCVYQSGTAILVGDGCCRGPAEHQPSYEAAYSSTTDTEHSANSEGSHDTGDSGRFSHESSEEVRLSVGTSATSASWEGLDLRVPMRPILSASKEPPDQIPPPSLQRLLPGQN